MLDFPNTPTTNQTFTSGGDSWLFDGVKWQSNIAQYSNNVGRNLIHNPLFSVAQRGAGPFTTGGYSLDRWATSVAGTSTVSISRANLTDADRTGIGDETAIYCLSKAFTGAAGASDYIYTLQPIEGIRRLAGKTVTISFWANAGAALKLGINLLQSFGTGGSPTAAAWVLSTGAAVTIPGTTFARYSVTIPVPSVAGKTLGTAGNDYIGLGFFYSSGSTVNATAGNIGVQSGIINLWGVQLEVGSIATPLEKPDPQQDLAKCQRFYSSILIQDGGYTGGTGPIVIFPYGPSAQYPTTMRASPTLTLSGLSYNNCSALNVGTLGSTGYCLGITVTNPGLFQCGATLTASADL
jgi:hypothetical protein